MMPEEAVSLMGKLWPRLSDTVAKELARWKLGDFVSTVDGKTSQPWRISDITWVPPVAVQPLEDPILKQARVAVEGAFEVSREIDVTMEDLRNESIGVGASVETRVADGAARVGIGVVKVVFDLLQSRCAVEMNYNVDSVRNLVRREPREWRLIGYSSPQDPTFDEIKKSGIVDTVLLPARISFKDGIRAILLPTLGGASVSMVDAPTLSWQSAENGVRIRIVRRFLFVSSGPVETRLLVE